MSKTDVRFSDFVKYVHTHFESEITSEEVEKILYLEEDYNKDNPISLGKSLLLNRLVFSGTKLSGENFRFDQKFYSGINVWIADNLKGKSTIFKIIKYALTGADNIKADIKKWISEIILEFQIGSAIYTIYIDKTGRDKGSLFSFGIDQFLELKGNQKLDTIEQGREFDFKSRTQMEEKMQEFFFEHFSFYTLKFTSKTPGKEQIGLSTGNLRWSTYFKSIYLESKDYEFLFFDTEKIGSQGKKIFEMVLGLRLTYPINMLSLQHDKVLEEIGKLKLVDRTNTETRAGQKSELEKNYAQVLEQINSLKSTLSDTGFDEGSLVKEYNDIQDRVNESRKKLRLASEEFQKENSKLRSLEEEIENLENDKRKIKEEINQLTKKEQNVSLYKDANGFFSNLDIKVCPHCETDIAENKKTLERQNHVCSLCGETATLQRVEDEELETTIGEIREEKKNHQAKLDKIKNNITRQKSKAETIKRLVEKLNSTLNVESTMDSDTKRLNQIEERIQAIGKQRKEQQESIEKREGLIRQEAVLKFQLSSIESGMASDNSQHIKQLELRARILEYALGGLEKKRSLINRDIINKLEELILKEIHAFGLSSINKIEINDKYDLVFTQNQVKESFNDLNEGEKLRVKLAFYLSLIQLDIEHNLGRHPRFLIFDSPGSEEMIPEHLSGLADVFKGVNQRLKENLQIFIGTAIREFSAITDSEKTVIKEKHHFVF